MDPYRAQKFNSGKRPLHEELRYPKPSAPLAPWSGSDDPDSHVIEALPKRSFSNRHPHLYRRSSSIKDISEFVQQISEKVVSSAGSRGGSPPAVYEVECELQRREYELDPGGGVARIVDTDLNVKVTVADRPAERVATVAASAAAAGRSGARGRWVPVDCPFCEYADEVDRRYLNGSVTCDHCLRTFFVGD